MAVHTQLRSCPLCNGPNVRSHRDVTRSYAATKYQLRLGKCANCNFIFLLNDPHVEYDEEYLYLEHVVTTGDPLARFRAQERVARIAQFIPPSSQRCFLDIGIGDGLMLSLAEVSGYSTFGLDVNPDGVKIAREQYGLRAVIKLDPPEQAFPEQQFDVIHMNEVIEHIAQPMPLLKWCHQHLKPEGCLVIQTGNIDSLASRIKGNNWDYFRPVHVSYFSTRTLSYAVQLAGFKILYCASTDWRLGPVLWMTRYLLHHDGIVHAFRFLNLYLTAIPHGIRRTVLVYAS